ncbi:hypothetical protein MF406_10730 [Georgenia sp. TF02-10]|uniref:hypothetical protein n=1 Tax=Georgenia sp. TF02-10 TaxID=2917725 RepID=UPI001FA6E21A|nr:hypothetical protein [Georgenia sp. TF02-10]UNX53472.1 hypothetical protein MF406_10730 [Georgenia sp. TF02-10]
MHRLTERHQPALFGGEVVTGLVRQPGPADVAMTMAVVEVGSEAEYLTADQVRRLGRHLLYLADMLDGEGPTMYERWLGPRP